MPDPMESIAQEAETGATVSPEGEAIEEAQGPSFGDRAMELFKPCPDDPAAYQGTISRLVNNRLASRIGVQPEEVHIGENLSHCIDHLFPGGGTAGWPPIINLGLSILEYRDLAKKHPDTKPLVRQ